MGHGREAYVWSLLAAVGLFVVGAAVSIWHGISELLHEPGGPENYTIAYVVLGIALEVPLLLGRVNTNGRTVYQGRYLLAWKSRPSSSHVLNIAFPPNAATSA